MNNLIGIKIFTPILLIGFNRPNVIKEAFAFIRASKPAILYVAIDQARSDVDGELQLVSEVKKIVQDVDWDCQVSYKFNETNLGAEKTVSSAVSWVLETEETVIVLEDDIIVPWSFLYFAQEMLEKYKNSDDVYMVSSNQFTPYKMDADYTFSIYGHTWGWATWRRAWNAFDLNIDVSSKYIEILEKGINQYTVEEQSFYKRRFEKMKSNGIGGSTWDLCWSYIRFINNGLTIVPKKNLSTNIGTYGLHAMGMAETHFLEYDENFVSRTHPHQILRNAAYDTYHFRNYINSNPGIIKRIWRRIRKISRIDLLFFSFKKRSYEAKKEKMLQL